LELTVTGADVGWEVVQSLTEEHEGLRAIRNFAHNLRVERGQRGGLFLKDRDGKTIRPRPGDFLVVELRPEVSRLLDVYAVDDDDEAALDAARTAALAELERQGLLLRQIAVLDDVLG